MTATADTMICRCMPVMSIASMHADTSQPAEISPSAARYAHTILSCLNTTTGPHRFALHWTSALSGDTALPPRGLPSTPRLNAHYAHTVDDDVDKKKPLRDDGHRHISPLTYEEGLLMRCTREKLYRLFLAIFWAFRLTAMHITQQVLSLHACTTFRHFASRRGRRHGHAFHDRRRCCRAISSLHSLYAVTAHF